MKVKGLPARGWTLAAVWFEDDHGVPFLDPPARVLPPGTDQAPPIHQQAILRSVIRDTCSAYGYARDLDFTPLAGGRGDGFEAVTVKLPGGE